MFPEPLDPMDRAMQRMDKKAWAEVDAKIATLKARLAEANDLNVVRRTAMVNLHEHIEKLDARLAEAERLLFALRDGIAVADFGDWNLLDQVDSFRSGDSTASSASVCLHQIHNGDTCEICGAKVTPVVQPERCC